MHKIGARLLEKLTIYIEMRMQNQKLQNILNCWNMHSIIKENHTYLLRQVIITIQSNCYNAYCQFSQQACTNFMQTYLYLLISTHFFILTTNLHWKILANYSQLNISQSQLKRQKTKKYYKIPYILCTRNALSNTASFWLA